MRGRDSTRILIGSMPLARASVLPQAITEMLKAHPHVQLRTIEGPYNSLLHGLRHGEIDFLIGALRDPVPTTDVAQDGLFVDDLTLIVGASHPLANRSAIALAETLAFPWVAPPGQTPSGQYLSRLLDIPSLGDPPVRVVSSSFILVRDLLLEGDFVSIISRQQVRRDLAAGTLISLPIPLPGSARSIGLTTRLGWQPTATQARFLDIVRAICGRVPAAFAAPDASYTKTE